MSSQKIRVLIVDDQRLLREGVRIILEEIPDIEVVGEADNGVSATQLALTLQPDVILMDIRMPVQDGIEATKQIVAKQRQQNDANLIQILLLTTFDTPELVVEGIQAGAKGYVLKDCSAEELCSAVRTVARGQMILQTINVAQILSGLKPAVTTVRQENHNSVELEKIGLTVRELEIISLIAQGKNNKEIETQLQVSAATVKTHINHIFSKLEVRDRSQVVVKAHQLGLV